MVVLRFQGLLPILEAPAFTRGVVVDVGWVNLNIDHKGRIWPELLLWQRQTGHKCNTAKDHGCSLGSLLGSLEELCLLLLESQAGDIQREEVCSKAALAPSDFSHFVCLNINVLFGYKTANRFAFLLCFCQVQDFIRIWPYSKCAKKNDGSPWIPWFGWNWLQWWHLCKYCYLQAMLSGDSAFIYMGSFLCCSLYILNSSNHV